MFLLSSAGCRLLTVFKFAFFQRKTYGNIFRVLNGLNQDQDPVSPDQGPHCLQRLSADDKSRC